MHLLLLLFLHLFCGNIMYILQFTWKLPSLLFQFFFHAVLVKFNSHFSHPYWNIDTIFISYNFDISLVLVLSAYIFPIILQYCPRVCVRKWGMSKD